MLTSRFPGEVSGADLPTLTNPAGAGDMASGKQGIGQDGMVVTGNVPTPNSVTLEDGTVEVGVSIGGGGVFLATGTMATDNLLRAGKTVQVSVAASEFGNAEAADVAAGKTFTSSAGLAVTGTSTAVETGDATASASNILSGKTAYVHGQKVNGSMTNQGAKNQALNCGGSYTIPAGYHNGSGKVTANSLASQTAGTAAAADIASGKTAWVNGAQVTGSGTMAPARTKITPAGIGDNYRRFDYSYSNRPLDWLYIKTLTGHEFIIPAMTLYLNHFGSSNALTIGLPYKTRSSGAPYYTINVNIYLLSNSGDHSVRVGWDSGYAFSDCFQSICMYSGSAL